MPSAATHDPCGARGFLPLGGYVLRQRCALAGLQTFNLVDSGWLIVDSYGTNSLCEFDFD